MRSLKSRRVFLAGIVAAAGGIFSFSLIERLELRRPSGGPQLVSVEEIPASGDYCEPGYDALPEQANLFDTFGEASVYAGSQESGQTGLINRPPTRTIRDMDPIYSSVAVDLNFDEVVLMDNNSWALRIRRPVDHGLSHGSLRRHFSHTCDSGFENAVELARTNGPRRRHRRYICR